MRQTPNKFVDKYRAVHPTLGDSEAGENWGFFLVPVNGVLPAHGDVLRIVATNGEDLSACGWEHVSVSLADRCPTWEEMCLVKRLFWSDRETVFQFHPEKAAYVNYNPNVLHLWRKRGENAELPPVILIGPID